MTLSLHPIGIVRSSFITPEGMPIQAVASDATETVEICPRYVDGLRDLDGFDHVILLYQFHLTTKELLRVTPFLDNEPRGVFATRAPTRPNRIGLSIVRLLKITVNVLDIGGVDMASGTPVIDIKPYVPAFDARAPGRIGWFAGKLDHLDSVRADDRMR
jgi:tRNA-Thr(GGU) m(6)t(6)A37 methyltransferase TsaA